MAVQGLNGALRPELIVRGWGWKQEKSAAISLTHCL